MIRIAWAYPTSDYAEMLGFYETGCWVVETIPQLGNPDVKGFSTASAAKFQFDMVKFGYKVSPFCVTVKRETDLSKKFFSELG